MFVLLGIDEDWYTFETYRGVFATKRDALKAIENLQNRDYGSHDEYKIIPVTINEIREPEEEGEE